MAGRKPARGVQAPTAPRGGTHSAGLSIGGFRVACCTPCTAGFARSDTGRCRSTAGGWSLSWPPAPGPCSPIAPRPPCALQEAETRRLGEVASLNALLARHPRRRGTAKLRSVLAEGRLGDGVSRSELEVRFLAFLDAAALPRPEINRHVESGGRLIECDCLWRAERLVVELDGHATHGRRSACERDRARD